MVSLIRGGDQVLLIPFLDRSGGGRSEAHPGSARDPMETALS